jgi:urease accessory protein
MRIQRMITIMTAEPNAQTPSPLWGETAARAARVGDSTTTPVSHPGDFAAVPPHKGEGASFLRLLTWLSPAFPVGAFGYSHGLETAIRAGLVTDGQTLAAWLSDLFEHGSGWTDAVLLAAAHRGEDVVELATALAPSRERQQETLDQGQAFLIAVSAAWPHPGLPRQAPYPVAVGIAAALHGIPLADTLTAWLHAFAANLTSVAVRAVPIGQAQGVATLAALEPVVLAAIARAATSSLDDLGACALVSDVMAMRHESLQPRLFLS